MAQIFIRNDDPEGPGDELSELLVIIGNQQAGVIEHFSLVPGQGKAVEIDGDNAVTVSKRWRDAIPKEMPKVN